MLNKKTSLLSLCILVFIPLFGMNNEQEIIASDCCGLGSIIYSVAKHIGRNDFLYLAHANSTWFLRRKLQLKEYFQDRDKYYIRVGRVVGGTEVSLYHTPLHEAIKEGNVETVALLCSVGADVHKKIKSAQEVSSEEAATEPHGAVYLSTRNEDTNKDNAEIQKFNARYHVGLSALELATLMRTKSEDKPSEREEIECFLIGYDKKD